MGLTLAFDTATHVATVAVLDGNAVLGERLSNGRRVLLDGHELLAAVGARPTDLSHVVVGTGPGSFTGVRIGIAAAHGLQLALGVPVAGVSTLAALVAGTPGSVAVIDAGRREVFAAVDGVACALPAEEIPLETDSMCVGDGALRYRAALERMGATVLPDGSDAHIPHARLHAGLARDFGSADLVEPVYVRPPDAKVPA